MWETIFTKELHDDRFAGIAPLTDENVALAT
jgi:hypothetical protein